MTLPLFPACSRRATPVVIPSRAGFSTFAHHAAQGFIITATGPGDSSGNVVLVGTRVQGDTVARAFVAAQGSSAIQAMMQQGYANVGVIVDFSNPNNPYTYLGER